MKEPSKSTPLRVRPPALLNTWHTQDNESLSDATLAEAGRAVADMAATVIDRGARLDEASAQSLVSVSVNEAV